MCCLMRWTRNWSAVAAPSSAMQVLPTAAPDDRRDQERGGERLWPSLPGLERLGRSSQGSSDAVSPTGPSGPSEIASGSGAAAAGLRAVIAALQAFVLGWKGSVALGALGGLGGPRRMDALSAARHPAQALEAGSHYLSGASGYRELLAIGSFWLSGASGYRELLAMGAKPDHARRVAANSRCWRRNSGAALNPVLTNRWLADFGAPSRS
jgi:hypothetical protein